MLQEITTSLQKSPSQHMSENIESNDFNPEAFVLQIDIDKNNSQTIPVIINNKTTKSGRVVHQPKIYKDFFSEEWYRVWPVK